ncbi:MAG: hypothetical protein M3444_12950 [Acidobacteriota bacterium]|nr:hypothetical protein [Acidobacteriota bacterium]
MRAKRGLSRLILLIFLVCAASPVVVAQQRARAPHAEDAEFGPNVRAYLGYLRDEQEVVDDRVSRREVDRHYYLHNSNRIYALRQMALRLARESRNDYLPELEAVSLPEFEQLFDAPWPEPSALKVGEVIEYKLKYLGAIVSRGERFFLFARLDPYEQAELRRKAGETKPQTDSRAATTTQPAQTPQPAATQTPQPATLQTPPAATQQPAPVQHPSAAQHPAATDSRVRPRRASAP